MSPRSKSQNAQLREERRTTVRQAAVALFARNGFDGTSTADVAKAAGVSQGTVFVYFPTKEALYREAVLEPLAPTLELLRQLLTGPGSPLERMERLARAVLASFARQESYLMLVQQVTSLRDRFPDLAAELAAFTDATIGLMAAVIAEGQGAGQFVAGDARQQALFFYAMIHGCGLLHIAPPDDPVWAEAARTVLRLIATKEVHTLS